MTIVDSKILTTSPVRLEDTLKGGSTCGRSGFDTARNLGARSRLKALMGVKTVNELNSQYQVHSTQIILWSAKYMERPTRRRRRASEAVRRNRVLQNGVGLDKNCRARLKPNVSGLPWTSAAEYPHPYSHEPNSQAA